jgi:ParB/RepB/Spo0J family partition protein
MSKPPRLPAQQKAVKIHGDAIERASLSERSLNREKPIQIEWVHPDAIRPNPNNPRKHSGQQIRKLERDIRKNGFINPILITHDGEVMAGHARLEASKLAGLTEVPVIRLSFTKAQAMARNIWDNKSSDLSQFDHGLLGLAMKELTELDFNIEDTGFSVGESDLLIAGLLGSEFEDADQDIPMPIGPAISQPGDVWILGAHRVACGDAQSPNSYSLLMDGKLAHAAFTDVPYNLAAHQISGKGKIRHPSFKMAAGEMSDGRYQEFLKSSISLMALHSVDGSLQYHCIDFRHLSNIQKAAENIYSKLLNICVWVKANGGMGSLYRSRCEFVLVFKHGKKSHRNNIELGRHGRNRTTVWEYAGGNSFSGRVTDEGNLLKLHPTVKPVQMIADAILDCTARGEIVIDPFLGSGSTLIAAERTGRRCFAMEIDPLYLDVAIRRWQRHTGDHAVHALSGRRFRDMEEPQSGNAAASRKAGRHRTVRKSERQAVATELKSSGKVGAAEVPSKIRRAK